MSEHTGDIFVGIDVSKDTLEVSIRPERKSWSLANSEEEVPALVATLLEAAPTLIVVEATGGLQVMVAAEMAAAGLPVTVVNPRHVRNFAKASGRLAKTDRIDAEMLAHFGEAMQPEVRQLKDEETRHLAALMTRRRQMVQMLTAEKNRLAMSPKVVRREIRKHILWLQARLDDMNRDISDFIKKSPVWRNKDAILRSTPGVGPVLSVSLLAGVPELGSLNRKQIAALIGVAPMNRDSGRFHGNRSVWGGRAEVRAALYMATLTATRWNSVIREFYQRLIAAGKKPKVALTACMRKLLCILNSMIRNEARWNPRKEIA